MRLAVSQVALIDGLLPLLERAADPRVILVASGGALTEPLVCLLFVVRVLVCVCQRRETQHSTLTGHVR